MVMRNKYDKELKEVFNKLAIMCREVIMMIESSIKALTTHDTQLSHNIIEYDTKIDKLEKDIEEDCLKLLLMEQPVAKDFREVSAALKMITDLERIGDQASDICDISLKLEKEDFIKKLEHIPYMAKVTIQMVKDGVNSYINQDLLLARSLNKKDDEVDDLFNVIKSDLIQLITLNPQNADQAILLMMISKHLERIGDHAVNIGEWVEYSITGVRK
ncbi:phosphate signaling complex protein PhoU [Fusobacterium sp. PH5-44]|uniref:phosphate signaling complex protein PhoU n=1 Tax=unclassified Fusobacterium TaxID=2648384 RepID=UPI003D241B44